MRKALIVMDLQNDYLWANRKEKFSYDTSQIINKVNDIIKEYQNNGYDIIYIAHVIHNNWLNNKIFGFSLRGTQGVKLYDKLDIVSDYYFEKLLPSAFSSRKFVKFMKDKQYNSVVLCGIDQCGCVYATANNEVNYGISVEMIMEGTATIYSDSKAEKIRSKLKRKGVKYI